MEHYPSCYTTILCSSPWCHTCRDHTFSRLLILLYLLHLLDFTWQDYDHTLLNELNLPELYLTSAISTLSHTLATPHAHLCVFTQTAWV